MKGIFLGTTARFTARAVISALVLIPLFWSCLSDRKRIRVLQRTCMAVLVLLAAVSVLAYFEFGHRRYGIYMNPHDMFHYYMGSKYSRELGYYNLYRCALIADMEEKKVYQTNPTIRNLETHRFESVSRVLKQADLYKEPFSEARWLEFKNDILYFQSLVPVYKWHKMLRDKGYNGTPVWNMVARFLAGRIPTSSVWGMRLLALLDVALLLIMFALVWGAFGWRVTLFALIFYGTNFMMSFVHIKGAFLRLDWVASLVIATCLIKSRYYKSAGAVMAYAGMARIFPLIFMFGMGAKPVMNLVKHAIRCLKAREARVAEFWTENKRYIEFFAAFAITSLILVGLSLIDDGGSHYWKEFMHKIGVHNREFSTTRVGFKYVLIWPWIAARLQMFGDYHTVWLIVESVVLLLSFWLVQKLEDYETIPYGFVPAFFMTAPTFYYYVLLIVPLFMFAPKLRYITRTVGLATMFLFSLSAHVIYIYTDLTLGRTLSFILSCMLLAFALYIMFASLVAAPARADEPAEPVQERSGRERTASKKFETWMKVFAGIIAVAGILLMLFAWWPERQRTVRTGPSHFATSHGGVQLVFAGDVMLGRNVAKSISKKNRDYTFPFEKVASVIREADVAFCNLEGPISVHGERVEQRYTFKVDPKAVNGLTYAGFDVVSLANNHILDYGPTGLSETIAYVEDSGIRHIGISDQNQPQTPAVFESDGLRIGYLAYADPKSPFMFPRKWRDFTTVSVRASKEAIEKDIAQLKENVDIVVVSVHWGIEYQTEHSDRQEELGRFMIDSGADIIAGHHPHVQQEPELYNGGLIIYSMGNFVFDQWTRPATRQSRLYRVWVDKEGLVAADYIPLEIVRYSWQPTPTAKSAAPVLEAPSPVS